MLEAISPSNSSQMGILITGDNGISEDSRKRMLENDCRDVGLDVPVKYKRRKVSANRDFPKDCGRFAPRINTKPSIDGISVDSDGNLKARGEGALVEPDPVKQTDRSLEPGALEVAECSDHVELPNMLKSMRPETAKSLEDLDEAEMLKPNKTVEPMAMESPKALEQKELVDSLKTLKPENVDSSMNLNKTELLNSMKCLDGPKSRDLLGDVSHPEEREFPSRSPSQSPIDSLLPDKSILSKVSDQLQMLIPVAEAVEGSVRKKYPPRKSISACRDFPPGCGRNAPHVSKEEILKSIAYSKSRMPDYEKASGENRTMEQMVTIREKVENGDPPKNKLKSNITQEIGGNVRAKFERDVKKEMTEHTHVKEASENKLKEDDTQQNNTRSPRESKLFESDLKSPSFSKKVHRDIGSFDGKSGRKSVKLSKDMSLKRKFPGKSEDDESTGFGTYSDRVVVQALMAAPNCPWRQGKRAFKTPTSLIKATARTRGKKYDIVVQDDSKSARKRKDETENSEEYVKEKMSPTGKVAYEGMDQLANRDEDDYSGHDEEAGNLQLVKRSQDLDVNLIPFSLCNLADKDDNCEAVVTRNKVRETLRLFQAIFRKLLQEEEAKSKEQVSSKRIDLIAGKILKEKQKWVNVGKPILGPVPGVDVGDEFHYRVELAIIGLHRPFQSGIDYAKRGGKILATSIVASGGYDDDMGSSDVLLYSGQGGNPSGGEKKAEDQKLERGNLALKYSMDETSPVRVIRGFKETKGSDSHDSRGKLVMTYTYDGLYLVEKFWQEKGRYGTNIFMFQLRRIPGQPELAQKEVKKSKKLRIREGLCADDISQGKEKMPICAVNTIDDEKPPPFKYITSMIYPSWYNPLPPRGCECTGGCSDSVNCLCAVKNGGEIPFNYNGAIVQAKPLVYECGPSCKCPPSCHNRVSQHGMKFQLEIFKTESRGWGVRSLTSIPSGSFICEYIGELLQDKEAEQRTGNDEYLFDIGHNYNDRALWDGLSTLISPVLQTSSSCETVEDVGFTIDAAQYGSVGRFINHSCSPNLYAQDVLYDHDEKRMPHIMLFAAENIPPLQELTYHYNYMLDQVRDSDGNIKKKDCYCGSLECTGRLY